MNLIFLGPPGSGKGTQAKLLAEKYNLLHISTGQLLRDEVKKDTDKAKAIKSYLDKGQFVPFDTILELMEEKILNASQGFILDGAPRNLSQAQHLDWFFDKNDIQIKKVIFLSLTDQESTQRLLKRAKSQNRSDDSPQVIKNRLKEYHRQTKPVVEFYQDKDLLLKIDASPDIQTIHQTIVKKLS